MWLDSVNETGVCGSVLRHFKGAMVFVSSTVCSMPFAGVCVPQNVLGVFAGLTRFWHQLVLKAARHAQRAVRALSEESDVDVSMPAACH